MQVQTQEVGGEKATTPRGTTYDSRIADKFVVRMPNGIRQQVDGHATAAHISMNSFIVQAIEEKLDVENRQQLMLDALVLATQTKQPTGLDELEAVRHWRKKHDEVQREKSQLRTKAELYDEVWALAANLGHMNVTTAIETLRGQLAEARRLLHTSSTVMSRMIEQHESPRMEIIAFLEDTHAPHAEQHSGLLKEGAKA